MASKESSNWKSPYEKWSNGPPKDQGFFPILVWAQDVALADQYKELGVNTYFALHGGPTREQLDRLRQAGLFAICRQNDVALTDSERSDSPIIAWMHGDEPDNRRKNPDGSPGGPRDPEEILRNADNIRANDPTRPIVVNFGQGVANDEFPGRGASLEQYPIYSQGADIVSFDVYPVANLKRPGPDGPSILDPNGADNLWYVAKGVGRLRGFVEDRKPVWNVLECTHIHNPDRIATPHQVRAEAWMSLIHGSRGLCWFVHDFREGHKNSAALLANPEMRQAVAAINREVLDFAPVLNSESTAEQVRVVPDDGDSPIAATARTTGGETYIFAVGMRNQKAAGRFELSGELAGRPIEVLGEDRKVTAEGSGFRDTFGPYDVRIYRIGKLV